MEMLNLGTPEIILIAITATFFIALIVLVVFLLKKLANRNR